MKFLTLLIATLFISTAQCQMIDREEFDETIQSIKDNMEVLSEYTDAAHQKIDYLLWQIYLLQSRVEDLEEKVFSMHKRCHPMYYEACHE